MHVWRLYSGRWSWLVLAARNGMRLCQSTQESSSPTRGPLGIPGLLDIASEAWKPSRQATQFPRHCGIKQLRLEVGPLEEGIGESLIAILVGLAPSAAAATITCINRYPARADVTRIYSTYLVSVLTEQASRTAVGGESPEHLRTEVELSEATGRVY